jgi:hypothetical protein
MSLPRNLKSLSLSNNSGFCAFSELMAIDKLHFTNLETLHLLHVVENGLKNFQLPSTLRVLHLGSNSFISQFSLSILPPYLEKLQCSFNSFEMPSDKDAKFPETLRSVDFATRSRESLIHLLPRKLEELDYFIIGAPSDHRSDWNALSELELKHLSLVPCGFFDVEDARLLPRTLVSLILESQTTINTPEWTSRILPALPQKLKLLLGVWPEYITADLAKLIPRTLEWNCHTIVNDEAVSLMPQNSPKLNLNPSASHDTIQSFPSLLSDLIVSRVDERLISLFPKTLKMLTIREGNFTLEGRHFELLPENLETIRYNSANHSSPIDRLESLRILPRQLRQLTLVPSRSIVQRFSNFVALSTPHESSLWLPPQLVYLQLGCIESPSAQWFANLPSTLAILDLVVYNLDLIQVTSFENHSALRTISFCLLGQIPQQGWGNCLKGLPPKSISLKYTTVVGTVEGVKTDLTDEDFKRLPASLTQLELPNCPLVGEPSFAHCPEMSLVRLGSRPAWRF